MSETLREISAVEAEVAELAALLRLGLSGQHGAMAQALAQAADLRDAVQRALVLLRRLAKEQRS